MYRKISIVLIILFIEVSSSKQNQFTSDTVYNNEDIYFPTEPSQFDTTENEDMQLNITQLIRKYGHAVEEHEVQTLDGYELKLFRIPGKGPVVLLMHGILNSADDFITPGVDSGLAYLLAKDGYDVWMGNARGNKHGRKHENMSPKSAEFWNFSWHEIGTRDLPATIDYILNSTDASQLAYIGHSQGTTSFFAMCSEMPEYNDKISLMVALSAVAWMSHATSPLKLVAPIHAELHKLADTFKIHELLPFNQIMQQVVHILCGSKLKAMACHMFISLYFGLDVEQFDTTSLPVVYSHLPAGSSVKQVLHYLQLMVSGKFRKFDYGMIDNMLTYGSLTPPRYKIENVKAAVAIFHADNDLLSNVTDVKTLRRQLPNVVEFYNVPYQQFNHMDYLWAKDVKPLVYSKVAEFLKKYVK